MTSQSGCSIATHLRYGPFLPDAKLRDSLEGLIEADVSNLDLLRNGRHYDALKAQNDIPFDLMQVQAALGPVLEIGCGTEQVILALAAAGVNAIGFDVSVPMLQEANRKAERQGLRVKWIEADGRTFKFSKQFALIIMPLNTLQFFWNTVSLQQLFYQAKSHLGGASQFIFDVFNLRVSFLATDPAARYERARYPGPEGRGEVVIEETREYLSERRVVRSTLYSIFGGKRDVSANSL
jgi:SAM-dependent methyltransferase